MKHPTHLAQLETAEAIRENNRVDILDGLCNTEYVLMGAVLSWGYRAMWEAHKHTVTLRKIRDTNAHLAKMLVMVNHLEIVSQGGMEWSVWSYLVELQEMLTELVFAMGFSPVFDAAFAEVARSNMTKLWTHGEMILYCDGAIEHERPLFFEESEMGQICRDDSDKIIKSHSYSPASLEQFV